MSYKILSKKAVEDTVITTVEYSINGILVVADVSHFRPSSLEDIELGIANREATEKSRLESAAVCAQLINEIQEN